MSISTITPPSYRQSTRFALSNFSACLEVVLPDSRVREILKIPHEVLSAPENPRLASENEEVVEGAAGEEVGEDAQKYKRRKTR